MAVWYRHRPGKPTRPDGQWGFPASWSPETLENRVKSCAYASHPVRRGSYPALCQFASHLARPVCAVPGGVFHFVAARAAGYRIRLMHPMLNIAVKAARRAGQIINRASLDLDLIEIRRKQQNDFVTEVDKAAEEAIIETLKTAYP
ncbi:MAG TPA: inositol monophosphatase family protein, partial [Burkholderia sp.]|nr:inositol monophosphatase family protein [Burkholderia sp.]